MFIIKRFTMYAIVIMAVVAFAGCNKGKVYSVEIELYPDKAPISVLNFYSYVDNKFYNGTIFHRVIPDFMIQGGGFTKDMKKKSAGEPIKNEANNGLLNDRGTIAMARTSDINSATTQFFINVKDNPFLNFKDDSEQGYGYAVFGKVVKGLDVVDKIKFIQTTTKGFFRNVPVEPVIIESIERAPNRKNVVIMNVRIAD